MENGDSFGKTVIEPSTLWGYGDTIGGDDGIPSISCNGMGYIDIT